jgi:predicted ABC-class ATPase
MNNKKKRIEQCEKAIVLINDYIECVEKGDRLNLYFLCGITGSWIRSYILKDSIWIKSKYNYKSEILWYHDKWSINKRINLEIHIEKRRLLKRVIKLLKQEDADGDT